MSFRQLVLLFSCFALPLFAASRMVPASDAVFVTAQSSNPYGLTRAGSLLFFGATDAAHGTELWFSDGTSSGTRLVKDFVPGSGSSSPVIAGAAGDAVIVSVAHNQTGREVWRSDGTEAGTYRLMTVPQATSVSVIVADSRVFATARSSDAAELWASDGGRDDGRRLGTFNIAQWPAPVGANGRLYFLASDAIIGSQLWVSDGTLLGTHMIQRTRECAGSNACGPRLTSLLRIGSTAFFTTADGLWRTDGTPAGTVQVFAAASITPRVIGTDRALFTSNSGKTFYSDGVTVTQILDAPMPSRDMLLDNGRYLFTRSNGTAYDIWRSDGSVAGTVQLAPLTTTLVNVVGSTGSRALWAAQDGSDVELWTIDSETGVASLLKDIDARQNTGTSGPSGTPGAGVNVGGIVYFPATDLNGRELWQSDGTAAGTKLVKNIAADERGGVVTGTVRDATTLEPIGGGRILLCDTTNFCETETTPGNDGTYRFEGIIPASYRVFAIPPTDHVNKSSALFTVAAGFETQGIDVLVSLGGRITGTVTRASNGEGLHAHVAVRTLEGVAVTEVSSGPDYRSRPLPPGSYRVIAYGWSRPGDAIDQVYKGAPCPAPGECGDVSGSAVTVTAGHATRADFSLGSYGRITTAVRNQGDLTLEFPTIEYISADRRSSSIFSYRAAGNHASPPLFPGSYYVVVSRHGYKKTAYPNVACVNDTCDLTKATPVTVTMDGTTHITVVAAAETNRLTGIVRDSAGLVVPFESVALLSNGTPHRYAHTDTNGVYAFADLPAGTYTIEAASERSGPVTLASDQTLRHDLHLRKRLTVISGRVLDATSGTHVVNSYTIVRLFDADQQFMASYSAPQHDGRYSIRVLSSTASLYVSAEALAYRSTAYGSGRVVCGSATSCQLPATAVPLAAGGERTGVDIALPRLGRIYGKVSAAATGGSVLQVVEVWFYTPGGAFAGSARSDLEGTYVWNTAEAGSYYAVVRSDAAYRGQVWPNLDCDTCTASTGTLIQISESGEVRNIDFRLQSKTASGSISGRVIDDVTGAPVAGINVRARHSDGASFGASTDANGDFTIRRQALLVPMVSGTYSVDASAAFPFVVTTYGDVQVTAPNATAGVVIRIRKQSLTSISPQSGPVFGGTLLSINGTNFTPGSTVIVGDAAVAVISATPTQFVVRTPARAAGYAHVSVRNPSGTVLTLAHAFTYLPPTFTDATLIAGATAATAVHVMELRDAINALRVSASLAPFAFTDASLAGARIRALHIVELRTALDQARAALGRSPLSYKNANMTAGALIRIADIMELRAGVQ